MIQRNYLAATDDLDMSWSLVDVISGDVTDLYADEDPHTVGGMSTLHRVYQNASLTVPAQPDLLYKRYPEQLSQDHGPHLAKFVRYLQGAPQIATYVPGLPTRMVTAAQESACGVLIPLLPGTRLDDAERQEMKDLPLHVRLHLAASLALEVACLQHYRIVHGDLNEPNVLVKIGRRGDEFDPEQTRIHIIDIDAGGIALPKHDNRYHPGLEPFNEGKPHGTSRAPETHLATGGSVINVRTDLWALAYLVHRIVFPRLDPFYWTDPPPLEYTIHDIYTTRLAWPQHAPIGGSADRYIEQHKHIWRGLASPLGRLFRRVFHRGSSATFDASRRPAASEWAKELFRASRSVRKCRRPECGEQYARNDGSDCPYCGHRQ